MKAKFITPLQKNLFASIASLTILAFALLFFWLGHSIKQAPVPKVIIREVTLITTPPPSPPAAVQKTVIDTPISIQVQGAGPVMQMIYIAQKITITKPDMPPIVMTESKWQTLEINWDAFELNELDGLPTLLTPLAIKFPKSLRRQGIKSVLVKLEVMIDEQGRLSLIKLVENPYRELNSEIQRLIRVSRFTAPKKDNSPVRARFVWPLEIKS